MALGAIAVKSVQDVIGILSCSVFLRMAAHTICRSSSVLLLSMSFMASFAIGDRMGASEWKSLLCMDFKLALAEFPVARVMAVLTVGTEFPLMVVGVTVKTGRADMIEREVLVTSDTLCGAMGSDKLITRFGVVEVHGLFDRGPRYRGVAILTIPFQFAVRILCGRLNGSHSTDGKQEYD